MWRILIIKIHFLKLIFIICIIIIINLLTYRLLSSSKLFHLIFYKYMFNFFSIFCHFFKLKILRNYYTHTSLKFTIINKLSIFLIFYMKKKTYLCYRTFSFIKEINIVWGHLKQYIFRHILLSKKSCFLISHNKA